MGLFFCTLSSNPMDANALLMYPVSSCHHPHSFPWRSCRIRPSTWFKHSSSMFIPLVDLHVLSHSLTAASPFSLFSFLPIYALIFSLPMLLSMAPFLAPIPIEHELTDSPKVARLPAVHRLPVQPLRFFS